MSCRVITVQVTVHTKSGSGPGGPGVHAFAYAPETGTYDSFVAPIKAAIGGQELKPEIVLKWLDLYGNEHVITNVQQLAMAVNLGVYINTLHVVAVVDWLANQGNADGGNVDEVEYDVDEAAQSEEESASEEDEEEGSEEDEEEDDVGEDSEASEEQDGLAAGQDGSVFAGDEIEEQEDAEAGDEPAPSAGSSDNGSGSNEAQTTTAAATSTTVAGRGSQQGKIIAAAKKAKVPAVTKRKREVRRKVGGFVRVVGPDGVVHERKLTKEEASKILLQEAHRVPALNFNFPRFGLADNFFDMPMLPLPRPFNRPLFLDW